jgi:hypothetical protein
MIKLKNYDCPASKALQLAELMYYNPNQCIIEGVTYYRLPTEYHMLYIKERGFGMKKTIKHKREGKLKIGELAVLIWNDWNK